jgi:hypothetical protein
MVKTRRHGQGAIESIHHDGYMGWARGRLRYRGDPYPTDGIGAGAAALADRPGGTATRSATTSTITLVVPREERATHGEARRREQPERSGDASPRESSAHRARREHGTGRRSMVGELGNAFGAVTRDTMRIAMTMVASPRPIV